MDYIKINKDLWNSRTEAHLKSSFYNVPAFLQGANPLHSIEIALLGNVREKTLLHLQCHFGMDTLQLARMGAEVTGADLSNASIDAAKELTLKTNLNANFICSDLYQLPEHLHATFDIVFTSYGTVGWLPDITKWAKVVAHFLKPGGIFVMADFHPFVWMFDGNMQKIQYRYFQDEPIIEIISNTYADGAEITPQTEIGWNHGLAEIIQSLINEGLVLQKMEEYDYSPYNCFKDMVEVGPKMYRFGHLENKIPVVFGVKFGKPA